MEHFRRNKRAYGALFVGVAAGLEAYGWREGAVIVGMVSAFLLGAGTMKSDAEVKAGK